MSTTTAIAIYAAIVGTATFAWQVYAWRKSHTTQLSVKLSNSILVLPLGTQHVAMISAVNQSTHPVRVTSAGYIAQDGTKRDFVIFRAPVGASLPGTIEPRDSANTWLAQDEMAQHDLDPYRPLVAWVNTADDERFQSKPTTLMRRG